MRQGRRDGWEEVRLQYRRREKEEDEIGGGREKKMGKWVKEE